jgi:hypothetical protein
MQPPEPTFHSAVEIAKAITRRNYKAFHKEMERLVSAIEDGTWLEDGHDDLTMLLLGQAQGADQVLVELLKVSMSDEDKVKWNEKYPNAQIIPSGL